MAWDFETDPEFQVELDWVAEFVRNEIEPLEFVIDHGYDMTDPVRNALIKPLQQQVRARGLWACHLGPELGDPPPERRARRGPRLDRALARAGPPRRLPDSQPGRQCERRRLLFRADLGSLGAVRGRSGLFVRRYHVTSRTRA